MFNQSDASLAAQVPVINCPKCGRPFTGIGDARPEEPGAQQAAIMAIDQRDRMAYQAAITKPVRMTWSMKGCACWVSQEWASDASAELTRRRSGRTPAPVSPVGIPESQLNNTKIAVQVAYTAVLAARASGSPDVAAECRLIQQVDLLHMINATAYDKLLPIELSEGAQLWAQRNGFRLPPRPGEAPISGIDTVSAPVPGPDRSDRIRQAFARRRRKITPID